MITSVLLCLPLGSWVKDMCAAKIVCKEENPTRPLLVTKPQCEPQMVLCVQRVFPPGKGGAGREHSLQHSRGVWWLTVGGWLPAHQRAALLLMVMLPSPSPPRRQTL